MMNKKLQAVVDLVPTIKKMTGIDAAICVWNKEGIVEEFFKSEKIDVYFPNGFKMEDEDEQLYKVIKTGKPVYNKVPKEVFGIAVEGTITPIFDGDDVVGVITYAFSSEVKEEIELNINKLLNSVSDTNRSIEGISSGSITMKSNMNNIQSVTELVSDKLREALKVVEEIKQNAKLSNILALNASIESARAGEAGRGFSIVADEMRKFSNISKEASEKINSTLYDITTAVNTINESVNESAIIANDQSDSVNKLIDIFNDVSDTAKVVIKSCKEANNI